MKKKNYKFEFEVFDSIQELKNEDAKLVEKARKIAENAYAPYSHFFVGAAALLQNGKIVTGTNQENASYPVTICAERTLLSSISTLYPKESINTIAITYHNHNPNTKSNTPISPCGMCRQSLLEYENKWESPIRLLLTGYEGKVIVINRVSDLLPLSFSGEDLKK